MIPGKDYTLNLVGLPRTDEQLQNIPRPYAELGTHITLKFVQGFSIIGMGAGAGVSAVQGQRDCESLGNKAFTYGQYGALAGLVVGPLITGLFVRGKSRDSIVDRSYRLRLNKGQVRADRWSLVGGAIGVGVAHYTGAMLEKGALFGLAGGCVLAGVANSIF